MAVSVLVVPAVVAALVLMAVRWVCRRGGFAGGDRVAAAAALGAGYLAGHLGNAPPAFPPLDVTDRLPWLAGAATLLGILEAARPSPAWARWENRLLMAALVLGVVLGPVLEATAATRPGQAWLAGLGLALLLSWANLEALAARLPGAVLGPALLLVAVGAAAALVLSGSLVLGQLGGALAAALAAVGVLSGRSVGLSLGGGGVAVLVATLGALLLEGHVYAALPASAACALAAAPAATWAGAVGPIRRAARWKAALVAAVATLVPVGLALGLVLAASLGAGE
jgi:hypothetical protein